MHKKSHQHAVHAILNDVPLWQGMVPGGFTATCVGSFIRNTFVGRDPNSVPYYYEGRLLIEEEIFEWIDMLEAIDAATESFTMVELGAGYGRWITAAAVVLRRHKSIPFRLVGVEAEPDHFEMMKQHLRDNGLVPENHTLIHAAITPTGRPAHFIIGHADTWWGQAIVPDGHAQPEFPNARTVEVPGVSLADVLEPLDRVDFCDIDIQGAEAAVIDASIDVITNKVRRLHIGTHSTEVETRLHHTLSDADWCCVRSYPHSSQIETDMGPINLADGVQTWLNRQLLRAPRDYIASSSSAKRRERVMSPTAVDLDSLRAAYEKASATLVGKQVVIETAPDPWGYAARIDLLPSKLKNYFEVEIDLEVEGDGIYLALASRDLSDIGEQKQVRATAGEKRTIYLDESKANGRSTILVRNGPDGGVSRVRIYEIRLSE